MSHSKENQTDVKCRNFKWINLSLSHELAQFENLKILLTLVKYIEYNYKKIV